MRWSALRSAPLCWTWVCKRRRRLREAQQLWRGAVPVQPCSCEPSARLPMAAPPGKLAHLTSPDSSFLVPAGGRVAVSQAGLSPCRDTSRGAMGEMLLPALGQVRTCNPCERGLGTPGLFQHTLFSQRPGLGFLPPPSSSILGCFPLPVLGHS